jgi:hypothetical protein
MLTVILQQRGLLALVSHSPTRRKALRRTAERVDLSRIFRHSSVTSRSTAGVLGSESSRGHLLVRVSLDRDKAAVSEDLQAHVPVLLGPLVALLGRNLTMDLQDAGARVRFLIRDRDVRYSPRSSNPTRPPASMPTDATALAASRTSINMPRDLHGPGPRHLQDSVARFG